MATYAFSDVHGHAEPLSRLLNRISPAQDDEFFMLGDMIDRGPKPVDVLRLCRDLPHACVLKGNHEDLMLTYLHEMSDSINQLNWEINGGGITWSSLEALDHAEKLDLLDWVENLACSASTIVGERPYLFAHAGIRPGGLFKRGSWNKEQLNALLAAQSDEDLMWIREEFWGRPTGLIDAKGCGPIVIAGHTPTPYLESMADAPERSSRDAQGNCRMVRVGAGPKTAGVSDRWDIDCGAAGGSGFGRIGILRLDDKEEFYEDIREGE